MYEHIKREKRTALVALLRAGLSRAECARELGVHPCTIGRELVRNRMSDGVYDVRFANRKARERRRASKHRARLLENDTVRATIVETFLMFSWSPEQIENTTNLVSHETIYAWIDRSRPDLYLHLRRKGKKRRRYGSKRQVKQGWTQHVRSIEKRPERVEQRSRIGDWEGDTIVGSEKTQRILVHVERKSGFVVADKLMNGTCDAVHAKTARRFPAFLARTITYDRGSEFALWEMIERDTRARVYFAHPRHPWERGTCENTNGLLREFFPKQTAFAGIMQTDVDRAAWSLNHRPRKRLSWRTPCEVFGKCCTSN